MKSVFEYCFYVIAKVLFFAILLSPAALMVFVQTVSANGFLFVSWIFGVFVLYMAVCRERDSALYDNHWHLWTVDAVLIAILTFTLTPLVNAGMWLYAAPITVWTAGVLLNQLRRVSNYVTKRQVASQRAQIINLFAARAAAAHYAEKRQILINIISGKSPLFLTSRRRYD